MAGDPGPHAHGYYRYQVAGQWKTVDITHQASSTGEMISTTKDLHAFFAALLGGKLVIGLRAQAVEAHPVRPDGR